MKQLLFLLLMAIAYSGYSQTSKVEWIKRIGDSGTDYVGAITTDANGNVYVAGGFVGQLIFNKDTLNSSSPFKSSAFLAKYDSMGNAVWGRLQPVTTEPDYIVIKNLRVSQNGRIFSTGYLDYNGHTRAYISINRNDGSQVVYYDNMTYAQHVDVDIDSNDNSYLIGHFNGTANNAYIFKLDSIGIPKWAYFSNQESIPVNVKYINGTVYIAGQFRYQYTLADTVGSSPITLSATNGINDYDFYIAQYSKDGKLLSGHKEDGVASGIGGPFEFSSDFSTSIKWNVTWGNSSGGIFLKQYDGSLSVLKNIAFPVTTPCPFQTGAYTKSSRFNEEGILSYSGLICPPFKNYLFDSAGVIQDTITNPTTGTIMSYTPSRDLTLGKSGNVFILSEFTGTLTYYDSTGSKTLPGIAGSQDLFVAKFHKCATYNPQILQNGDTLMCSIPGMYYQWYLNGNLISANGQMLIPATNGNYSVSVTDAWGCSNYSNSVYATVGIVQIVNDNMFTVSPNPFNSQLTIEGIKDIAEITITDVTGKVIVTEKISQHGTIDVSSLTSGVYFLRINGKAFKIVKY